MPRRSEVNRLGCLEKLVAGFPAAERLMEITIVYDEAQTRTWAMDIYEKIQTLLGSKAIRATWWNVADLGQPGVLAGAVSRAIRSDLVVVAVSCSEGLPLPFYYWVNAWLPHRVASMGALIGLLSAPTHRSPQSGRLRRYLQSVARRTRMDLMIGERVASGNVFRPVLRSGLGE